MSDQLPAAPLTTKADGAFRTIGEVAIETGVAQHILRYWEQHFPQLRPVTRAGGRRYYRPADVALVRRIDRLLNAEGYTLKGARQAISGGAGPVTENDGKLLGLLREVRDALAAALDESST